MIYFSPQLPSGRIVVKSNMKKLLILLSFFASTSTYSQSFYRKKEVDPWSVTIGVGPTQYFGELYSFWKYKDGIQPGWHANLGINYVFASHFKARLEGTYYKIIGSDPPSDPRANRSPRNLSFRATNMEAAALIEYYLYPVDVNASRRNTLNPYLFAGVGISTNNPKAELNGTWVDLRPLQLENNPYNSTVIVFPLGIGLKYKLSTRLDLKVEGNYRFTLTDYMDDISAFNVSEFYLDLIDDYVTGNNPDRLRLAIRNPDFVLPNGEPNVDAILENNGRIRRGSGLEERYDGYMTLNIGLEIYLFRGY